MKKLNPIPIIILILTFLNSCSSSWHIGTGDKMNNLTHWKADRQAKKDAKENVKINVAKY